METSSGKQIWHIDVLPRKTRIALDCLSNEKWLNRSPWYLAGGTALALQVGHRGSVDLDFFTPKNDFSNATLISHFSKNPDWKTIINKEGTVYGELLGAKISFIAYPFFVPKKPFLRYGAIHVLDSLDIAVMKVIAISQRGLKRDFIDLYWCAKNIEPLNNTISRLKIQYPSVAHDYHHILKSLVYFEDAESDPAPEIYFKASWKEVKKFFLKEIPRITKTLIKLDL